MRGSFVPDVKKDCSASSKGVLCQHMKGEWGNMLSRKKFTFCIRQTPSQFSSQWSDSIYHITRARKNYANYTQTLHLTLHLSDLPRVTKCIVWGENPTQTIHWTIHWVVSNPTPKLYMKAYTATRTLHKTIHKTLHCNPTLQRQFCLGAHLGKTRSAPRKN